MLRKVPVLDGEGSTLVKMWYSPQGFGYSEVSKFPNSMQFLSAQNFHSSCNLSGITQLRQRQKLLEGGKAVRTRASGAKRSENNPR